MFRSHLSGLFVAIKGTVLDGHEYIEGAIRDGAIAIVVEQIPINIHENRPTSPNNFNSGLNRFDQTGEE